jgi:cytoskeletal protein CcmA (bactofilin family)
MSPQLVGTSEDGGPAGRFEGDVDVNGTVNATHVTAQGNIGAKGNVNADGDVNTTRVNLTGTQTETGPDGAGVHLVQTRLECTANDTLQVTHLTADGNISARGNVNAADTVNATHVTATGNVGAAGNVNANGDANVAGTVNTNHVSAQGNISARGNVNARNLNVVGDIRLENADCAEEFDIDTTCAHHVVPGTVVVLSDDGDLRHSTSSYDKRVAGVVSGGGDFKPGIIFDQRTSETDRMAVALLGKVFCNIDASYGPVEVGDLLTTSDTPGHAMKASDTPRAFGAVIGKALRPLREGQALVPILVALQ